MTSDRLEAFTDGVLAIVITIMVLELKIPADGSLQAMREAAPVLLAYVLSFINVGIYWSNHHHLFQATEHIDGRVLWCNLFLLFWLSLLPFVIRWLDEAEFTTAPTAAYGLVLLMASLGWVMTKNAILARNGATSALARALGKDHKARLSVLAYFAATLLSAWDATIAMGIYVATTSVWFVPDRRIERALTGD